MGENGGEAVVFVEAGEGAGCLLRGVSFASLFRHGWDWKVEREARQTSSALSNLAVNSARTILICSRPGTYAQPPLNNTFLPSTNSGTFIQSTLNHPSSTISVDFRPWPAATSSGNNSFFSASPTASHSKFKDRKSVV